MLGYSWINLGKLRLKIEGTFRECRGIWEHKRLEGNTGDYRGIHDKKGCVHRGMELDLSKLRKTDAILGKLGQNLVKLSKLK